MTTLLTTRTL